ncbi:MAG: transcription antitermination factor NusB [Thermodesulfobacteriota bacterium]
MSRKRNKNNIPPARRVALSAVLDICSGADLQAALDRRLELISLVPEDRALCTALVYGYFRLKIRIDYILSVFLKKPERMPGEVLAAMGLAVFEILQMDRIPEYASVSWAAGFAKSGYGSGISGVVNAVLRNVCRNSTGEPDFFRRDNPDKIIFWSRYYSCPQWMVKLWVNQIGEEKALVMLESSIRPAPLGLRLESPFAKEKLGFKNEDILAGQGDLLALKNTPDNLVELEERGEVSRVSFAGQSLLADACASGLPEPVWDACSGRGGKSFLLNSLGLKMLCSDTSSSRLSGFKSEMKRLEKRLPLFAASAEKPPFAQDSPPKSVLLDVPCSGLGVLSRRPDIKQKRRPEDIAAFIRLQKAMLESALHLLPPGGQVLYMTCTLNREENRDQVARALENTPSLKLVQELENDIPSSQLGEYFYLARLEKG